MGRVINLRDIPAGLAFAAYKSAITRGERLLARGYEQQFLRTVRGLAPHIAKQLLRAYHAVNGGE